MTPADHATAARLLQRPWLNADPYSIWEASGRYSTGGDTFQDCLATCLPPANGGDLEDPIFTITVHGDVPRMVRASAIHSARRLVMVYATDPDTAYYDDDQDILDHYRSTR